MRPACAAHELSYGSPVVRRLRRVIVSLAAFCVVFPSSAACGSGAVLGDSCDRDEDCAAVDRDAVCYQGSDRPVCTLYCDRVREICAERASTGACLRMETIVEDRTFGAMDCDREGGSCQLDGARTICLP